MGKTRHYGAWWAAIYGVAQSWTWLKWLSCSSSSRVCFKKNWDTKGLFHANVDTIKDKNGMDLTEAEDIKKRWREHTEERYKNDLHDPGNHDGVITHPGPDILECEVRRALGSITMNKALVEVMEFQLSYFKSWKMMLWKCCTQYVSKFGKLSIGHRTGEGQFSFYPKERQCQKMLKLPHNCIHLTR